MRQRNASINRRLVLKTIAAAAAGAALPLPALAQESLIDTFQRNRVLRDTDRDANTQYAMGAIDTVEPIISYDTAYNLQNAIDYYTAIVQQGGWPELPTSVYNLILGNSRSAVADLRRQLVLMGDLPQSAISGNMFDADVDVAVRRFQARHGLVVTGKVDELTFYSLAVSAQGRLDQLLLNLERVDGLAGSLADRYVVVNIPAATIEAVEDGTVVQRHTAVVGRIDRQTPILQSRIHEINFNPYWHVPKSIIERDIIQYMNDDPEYLAKYRIRIFDGRGNEIDPSAINWQSNEAVNYLLRQDPGAENSMGHVKINFHNPHSVYLHDTPQQGLFGENRRFHSSGCVRVEGVDELVAWILRDNGYDVVSVNSTFAAGERLDVSVRNPVPIFTTYVTAWANRQGVVSFRDDVYEFDRSGRTTFAELMS